MTTNEIIKKLQAGELDNPGILADYLVVLSASLNTAGNFELEAEIEYMKKWATIKLSEKGTDKLIDAMAKQTEEYRTYRQMQIANKTILQTIMSLKKKLSNLQAEFQSGQNY